MSQLAAPRSTLRRQALKCQWPLLARLARLARHSTAQRATRWSVLHAGSAGGAVSGAQVRRLASCGGANGSRTGCGCGEASAAGARRGLRRC
eukprot:7234114-Prymnesium_polylepis.1